jgi:hypothetical protein
VKSALLALLLLSSGLRAEQKLTFIRSFPGSTPDYIWINIDRSGALQYKESPKDDQPLRAQLQESEAAALFAMAEKLDYFKSPLESGLKVANTGKKTFRYEGESGATETSFNYSTNPTAQQLLDRFEQIAAGERAYLELERAMRFDKLGINDALADVEALWLHKQLSAPQQFVPLLTRIASRESYMHLVRDRAARLKDEFEKAPVSESAEQKQK